MSKVRIIDMSNLTLICLNIAFMNTKYEPDEGGELSKNEVTPYGKQVWGKYFWLLFKKFKQIYDGADKVVFCFEGKDSTKWRKSVYPDYKGTRNHDEDPTWPIVCQTFKLTELVSKPFPGIVLSVDNCEADDEMYAAAKIESEAGNDIEIWTADKDLIQCINFFPNVKVFNPIQKAYREKQPDIIIEKAICGDGSDNIKGIKGIGPKTLKKMLEDKEEWNKRMTPENLKEYEKCLQIVDLSKCPFTNDIVSQYNSYEIEPVSAETAIRVKEILGPLSNVNSLPEAIAMASTLNI